jgi:hypothetical protein
VPVQQSMNFFADSLIISLRIKCIVLAYSPVQSSFSFTDTRQWIFFCAFKVQSTPRQERVSRVKRTHSIVKFNLWRVFFLYILLNNTLISVILTRTRKIWTQRVQFRETEHDFNTHEYDLDVDECNFDTHNIDFACRVWFYHLDPRVWLWHPQIQCKQTRV